MPSWICISELQLIEAAAGLFHDLPGAQVLQNIFDKITNKVAINPMI